MTEILNKKVAGFGLMDLAIIAGSKFVGEIVLGQFVGNSSLKSGVVKIALAGAASKVNKNVAVGLALDGAEDITIGSGVRDMIIGSVFGQSQEGGF